MKRNIILDKGTLRKKRVLVYKIIISAVIAFLSGMLLAMILSNIHSSVDKKDDTKTDKAQINEDKDGSDDTVPDEAEIDKTDPDEAETDESNPDEAEIDKNDPNLPQAPENLEAYMSAPDGKYITSNGFELVKKDGTAYIDGTLIVNKTFNLPETYKAGDPTNPDFSGWGREGSDGGLEKYVLKAFNEMSEAAVAQGLDIYVTSGYRCYESQEDIYNNCVKTYGREETDSFASRPGCSEHQSGLAIDLNILDESFDNTKEAKWLNDNCYKYGFCIRFPEDEQDYTGYMYESWHVRYVGKELAKKLYNDGKWISLEHYFGISSKYE